MPQEEQHSIVKLSAVTSSCNLTRRGVFLSSTCSNKQREISIFKMSFHLTRNEFQSSFVTSAAFSSVPK